MTETTTETRPWFYKVLPDGRFEFQLDHSMSRYFLTCERKFKYAYIDRIGPKGLPAFSMQVGKWWSNVMSEMYEDVALGRATKERSLEIAVNEWVKLKMDAYETVSPKQYKDFGGHHGAVLMIADYWDSQALIDIRDWKIIATEAGFGLKKEVLIGESDRVVVYGVGKPDKIVLTSTNYLCPVDDKTVDRIDKDTMKKWKPHFQFVGYVFAMQEIAKQLGYNYTVDRCIINICSRSQPSDNPKDGKKKPRFIRVMPTYSADEIAEWRQQRIAMAERLRYCIETDTWLMDDSACHVYGGCQFERIDRVTPASRPIVIAADYVKVEEWKPYEIVENGG